jgi:cyclic nucleotide gated channel
MEGYSDWEKINHGVLGSRCSIIDENSQFNYGIYTQAISSGIVTSKTFFSKFCYCLWWGLQNLRYHSFC